MTETVSEDLVDIIIPIWDQPSSTKDCIDGIIRNTLNPYRLVLVDNGSKDETRLYLEELKRKSPREIILIRNEKNLGFVKAVNQGLKASSAPHVCIMNNDTIPGPGWLERMVEFSKANKDVGMMNPTQDGDSSRSIEDHAREAALRKGSYLEVSQCFLFATLIKREVIEKIGYLDEIFGMGCHEDADYAIRAAKAGYRCVRVDSSYIHHAHAVSFIALGGHKKIMSENEKILLKKWGRIVRVGACLELNDNVTDEEIGDLLRTMLLLARDWCWISAWIFGNVSRNKERIKLISAKMGMPEHQSIGFNFLPGFFIQAQLALRIGERLFGTKKRKKYDIVIFNKKVSGVLKMLCRYFGIELCCLKPGEDRMEYLRRIVSEKKFCLMEQQFYR